MAQLVAHSLWERGVASSSLAAPTIYKEIAMHLPWISLKTFSNFSLLASLLFFSSTYSENSNFLVNSFNGATKTIDANLNNLGSLICLPDHTLSWVLGATTLIATPFILYTAYCYVDQFLLDRKPDSSIIKRSNAVLSSLAKDFETMLSHLDKVNAIELNDNEKIIAKFFFKEALLKMSYSKYPFLTYKRHVENARNKIVNEQRLLIRRIKQIKNRSSAYENICDTDNDCIAILESINNSLEILHRRLEALEIEIIECYEYRNDVMQNDAQIAYIASLANQSIFYAHVHCS